MFGNYEKVREGVHRGYFGPVDIWVTHMSSAQRLVVGLDAVGDLRRQMFRAALWDMVEQTIAGLGDVQTDRMLLSPVLTGGGLIIPEGLEMIFPGYIKAKIKIRRELDEVTGKYKYYIDEKKTKLTVDKIVGKELVVFVDECSASGTSACGALEHLISLGYRGEVWFACPVVSNYAIGEMVKVVQKSAGKVSLRVLCAGIYGILHERGLVHGKPMTDFVMEIDKYLPAEQREGCFIPTEQLEGYLDKWKPTGIICIVGDATDALGYEVAGWIKQLTWLLAVLRDRSRACRYIGSVDSRLVDYRRDERIISQRVVAR